MIFLVCGPRNFDDKALLEDALDRLHAKVGITKIIAGGANGADRMSTNWAWKRGIAWQEFPADWDNHGNAAGPIRNQQMLDEGRPDGVVSAACARFPAGPGTTDMIDRARKAGLTVWEPLK